MKKRQPIHIIMHHPGNAAEKQYLAKQIAEVHADAVNHRIQELPCPTEQKQQLLEAIISETKQTATSGSP